MSVLYNVLNPSNEQADNKIIKFKFKPGTNTAKYAGNHRRVQSGQGQSRQELT